MAGAGLPLWHVVRTAYVETCRNFRAILKLAWLPFLVVALTTAVLDIADGWRDQSPVLTEMWLNYREHISYARQFVVCLSFAIFAFAVFAWRLGEAQGHRRTEFSLGRRQLPFLSLVAAYFVIDAVLWEVMWRLLEHHGLDDHLTSDAITMLDWMVFLLELVVLSRLAFVLPIAALGHERMSDQAWILGNGAWFDLIGITLLTYGLLALCNDVTTSAMIALYISELARDSSAIVSTFVSFVLTLKSTAVSMFAIAVAVIALCEAYRIRRAAFPDQELVLPYPQS